MMKNIFLVSWIHSVRCYRKQDCNCLFVEKYELQVVIYNCEVCESNTLWFLFHKLHHSMHRSQSYLNTIIYIGIIRVAP